MSGMVFPHWPGFSVRFDADRNAWGIQDSASGAGDGSWIGPKCYELFTQAHDACKKLEYPHRYRLVAEL